MSQIKITTIDELIEFINTYNQLPFKKIIDVVQAYIGHQFIWFGREDKEALISEIENHRNNIEQHGCTGLFWNDKNYFSSDEWKQKQKEMN